MSRKLKKILSHDFGRDVGSIIEGYDERCDSDYDQCGNSTDKGERCLYQAVYRKDVDNPNAVMSCKHYCREHCEDSFKKLFRNLPISIILDRDENGHKRNIMIDDIFIHVKAGGGHVVLKSIEEDDEKEDLIQVISNTISASQIIRRDRKSLFSPGKISLCKILSEYNDVTIRVEININLERFDIEKIKISSFEWRNSSSNRWISNSKVWLSSIRTLSNGEKEGIFFLQYNISHRDEKRECYIFKPFNLYPLDDDEEDVENFLSTKIIVGDYTDDKKTQLIYDLDTVLKNGRNGRDDEERIFKRDIPKLKNIIKTVYDTMIDEYDKNRLENRYLNIFGESMNISDESKVYDLIQLLKKEFPEHFENVYFGNTIDSAKKAIGNIYRSLEKKERSKIADIYKEIFGTQFIVDLAREEYKDYIDEEQEIQKFKEELKKKNPKKPWAYKTETQKRKERERNEEILSLEDYDPYVDDSEKYRETSDNNDIGEVD